MSHYVNATVKINESLPDLIKKLEAGYGLGKSSNTLEMGEKNLIDAWHKNKEIQ